MLTDFKPKWIKNLSLETLRDKKLLRIIQFFLFQTPYMGVSAMGIPLEEHSWHDPWKEPYCLCKQLEQASSSSQLLYPATSYTKDNSDMDKALESANLKDNFPLDLTTERICFYKNDRDKVPFESVFFHMRNSFAHGRFAIEKEKSERVIILEDVGPREHKNKVSARMILKMNTLLTWIDIIEKGEKEFQE